MMPIPARLLTLALASLYPFVLYAQDTGLPLKVDPRLAPPPERPPQQRPVFLEADRVETEAGQTMTATGDVRLRQQGLLIEADRLEYHQAKSTAIARGNVLIDREGDQVRGPLLHFNTETQEGFIESPNFTFAKKPERKRAARGDASRLVFEGPQHERLYDTRYTTCPAGNDDWFITAKELRLDHEAEVGRATSAGVVFKDTRILGLPFFDFPLAGQRKSGFLAPTLGSNQRVGFEAFLPYYWNIAPNRDATISPRILTKRGLQLVNEFRYLEPKYFGRVDAEYLPSDRVNNTTRHYERWTHAHHPLPGMAFTLDLQRASDDNYFRELTTRIQSTSQVFLPRDGILTYRFADNWTAAARLLRYQVLQDVNNPVVSPYFLAPQVQLNGLHPYHGIHLGLKSEWVEFDHPTLITARRTTLNPAISYPWRRPYAFVTPRLSHHWTRYAFGENNTNALGDITRNVPTASVDSGLFFDRDIGLGGRSYRNTLEPRVFYVYTPFRDQTQIPNFSTAELDQGFVQIFSENRFIGGDRIADANHITVGATTRLIDTENGIERIRAVLAQRYYFDEQRVTLPGSSPGDQSVDLLAALAGQITDRWSLDSGVQYSTEQGLMQRYFVTARYRSGFGRIANLSYRFTRDALHQVDFSTQWRFNPRWQTLARLNYSLRDQEVLETLAGVEYNRDCWAVRAVMHRFPVSGGRFTTAFALQLELGLSAIGINPLEALRRNIPGYTRTIDIPDYE